MMHKAWCGTEEVLYFFQGHLVIQDHTAHKSSILTQIGRFWTVTPIWIQKWLGNDAQSLKW